MSFRADVDETARLVLMDECPTLLDFAHRVREVHPILLTEDLVRLWSKYRGMDGRVRPTHDVETGQPIPLYR